MGSKLSKVSKDENFLRDSIMRQCPDYADLFRGRNRDTTILIAVRQIAWKKNREEAKKLAEVLYHGLHQEYLT